MTDVITWLTATSEYMAKDRPDLYESDKDAFDSLSVVFDEMSEIEGPTWTSWAGFLLIKHVEDDITEWEFSKKISTAAIFVDEGVCDVYGWTSKSGTVKHGVDLPAVDDVL